MTQNEKFLNIPLVQQGKTLGQNFKLIFRQYHLYHLKAKDFLKGYIQFLDITRVFLSRNFLLFGLKLTMNRNFSLNYLVNLGDWP